jgi:hypothetical protein
MLNITGTSNGARIRPVQLNRIASLRRKVDSDFTPHYRRPHNATGLPASNERKSPILSGGALIVGA